jgi:predicted ArsR family transcriptional regulator
VLDVVNRTFASYGKAAGRAAPSVDPDPLDATADVLAGHGYEPRRDGDEVHLHNCPFHALAQAQTELICHANLCLVEALAEEVAHGRVDARLEPWPDRCCVVLHAQERADRA